MRVHFVHRNVQDTVVMLEEGNLPHPRCARCDMQVPRKALNGRHLGTCMSHLAHRGWGKFPSSSITTVSWTFRCTKCTRIAVLVARAPGYPSTGHRCGPPFVRKDILYVLDPISVWGVHRRRRPVAFPFRVIR